MDLRRSDSERGPVSEATKPETDRSDPDGDPFEPASGARLATAARLDRPEPSGVASEAGNPNRALVARKDGRKLRRTTVYLPKEVANRLLVYCAEHDTDISRVVTDAVRRLIGA